MIRIKSKRHLFRRCGAAHPKDWTEYPDDRFTEAELDILRAEPMLTVESAESGPAATKDMTVAELKSTLDGLGIEYPSSARKQDLIDLIADAGQPNAED
jgi:hypothetical protein